MNASHLEDHPELAKLDARVRAMWTELLQRPAAGRFLTSGAASDRRAYAMYLIGAYHYTRHTPRNQALVGANPRNTDPKYMQYCFEHAQEETGHELMALHDLKALGVKLDDPERDLPGPMPSGELLVAWLYWVAQYGNPVSRLGYSFWAERAYPHGSPFLSAIEKGMGLQRSQMTFFYVHAELDHKHADDVARTLVNACRTPEDWAAVTRTAEVTMRLTFQMLEEAFAEYERLRAGEDSPFSFLTDALGAPA